MRSPEWGSWYGALSEYQARQTNLGFTQEGLENAERESQAVAGFAIEDRSHELLKWVKGHPSPDRIVDRHLIASFVNGIAASQEFSKESMERGSPLRRTGWIKIFGLTVGVVRHQLRIISRLKRILAKIG